MAPTNERENDAKKRNRHPEFEPPTLISLGQKPNCWPTLFLVYVDPDRYVPIRTTRRLGYFDQKTKTAPIDASTAEAAPRDGKGEQGKARRANSTPNGGLHLDSLSSFGSTFTSSYFFVFLSFCSFNFHFYFLFYWLSIRSSFSLV